MKTYEQTLRHLRQRVFRIQKKYLEAHLKQWHTNCAHNRGVRLDPNKGSPPLYHVCTHPEKIENPELRVSVGKLSVIQDSPTFPRCEGDVSKCEYFTHRYEKEALKAEFQKIMVKECKNPSELAEKWPDLAQLMWVLEDAPIVDSEEPERPVEPIRNPDNGVPGTIRGEKALVKIEDSQKGATGLMSFIFRFFGGR